MKNIQKQPRKPNPTERLFSELSAEESSVIQGAYGPGYYGGGGDRFHDPYYRPNSYYRPNPYYQYHYTYYGVAHPFYLLS